MTRHEQQSALRPEILAGRCYVALLATYGVSEGYETIAGEACDAAAAFLAEWKRRDPDTAAVRFEGQDVPEARGLAAEPATSRVECSLPACIHGRAIHERCRQCEDTHRAEMRR